MSNQSTRENDPTLFGWWLSLESLWACNADLSEVKAEAKRLLDKARLLSELLRLACEHGAGEADAEADALSDGLFEVELHLQRLVNDTKEERA